MLQEDTLDTPIETIPINWCYRIKEDEGILEFNKISADEQNTFNQQSPEEREKQELLIKRKKSLIVLFFSAPLMPKLEVIDKQA